jgi:hypothetical protein
MNSHDVVSFAILGAVIFGLVFYGISILEQIKKGVKQ